jgi:hypothetical protein
MILLAPEIFQQGKIQEYLIAGALQTSQKLQV